MNFKKLTKKEFCEAMCIDRTEVKKIAQITSQDLVVYWLDGMIQSFNLSNKIKLVD